MDVADPRAAASDDDARAVLEAAQKHVAGFQLRRRDGNRHRGGAGGPPDRQRNLAADLAAKRADRLERPAIGRENLIADPEPGPVRRRPFDRPGDEQPALIVGLGEDPDPRIGDLAVRKDPTEPAVFERAGENVGELVIGRLVPRIVAGMGGVQRRQHRVDRGGEVGARPRSLSLRTILVAHRRPVDPVQPGIVEAIAHKLPDLIESGDVRLGRRRRRRRDILAPCGPGRDDHARRGVSQEVSARRRHFAGAPTFPCDEFLPGT